MGNSRATAPSGGEAFERGELLATKLTIPRIRPGSLGRSRLLDALDEAVGRELTLVCTPAGFGKTTLLADWAHRAKWPVAWLSLDPEDSDPVRFWRYVAGALDRAGVPVGERLRAHLTPPRRSSTRGVVAALLNELAALPEEVVLVLDDYHAVDAGSIHESLAYFLGHLPPQLHAIIASRSDPPLPLARMRARDQLAELRAADLRFTPEESAAFLQDVWGLDLLPEALAALESQTEGWAVGLQLAALSLRERPDPDAFLDAFAGTHRYVLDYLSEEVIERQPESVRTFLLDTSILGRLNGLLCDAVTGRSDGQEVLEGLERASLFLVPLDEQRRWYRYHHLFGDLLRAELERSQPGRAPALHGRAAAWCEAHGLIDEAVRHALASGEVDLARRYIEEHVESVLLAGEEVTAQRWLDSLPPRLFRSRPRLCIAGAIIALSVGRIEDVEPLLQQAECALEVGGQPPDTEAAQPFGIANVPATILILRAELAKQRGDAEATAQLASQASGLLAEGDAGHRYFTAWNVAVADLMQGRVKQAERAFAAMVAERWRAGHGYHALRASYELARTHQAQGRLEAALGSCRRGLDVARGFGRSLPETGIAHVGIAEVLRERDDLETALQHAEEGAARCQELPYFQWVVTSLATVAWVRHGLGDHDGAARAIDQAEGVVPARGTAVDLLNPLPVTHARILLATGDLTAGLRLIRERALTSDDEPTYLREREYLLLARILIARDAPDRAEPLLARLHALAAAQGRLGSVIEIRALHAVALRGIGNAEAALTALSEALSLAQLEGYVRVFADENAPMAALLRKAAVAASRGHLPGMDRHGVEYVHRLLDALEPKTSGGVSSGLPSTSGLVEQLTERELDVLRLLAAGRRNQDIAHELVVTLYTVKKHVTHIFEKLGVANRTEAVARARELDMLS